LRPNLPAGPRADRGLAQSWRCAELAPEPRGSNPYDDRDWKRAQHFRRQSAPIQRHSESSRSAASFLVIPLRAAIAGMCLANGRVLPCSQLWTDWSDAPSSRPHCTDESPRRRRWEARLLALNLNLPGSYHRVSFSAPACARLTDAQALARDSERAASVPQSPSGRK
jgi:hypothetical protein